MIIKFNKKSDSIKLNKITKKENFNYKTYYKLNTTKKN